MHIVKKQIQSMTLDGTSLQQVLGLGDGGSDSFPFALYDHSVQREKKDRDTGRKIPVGTPYKALKQIPPGIANRFTGCQIVKSERQGMYLAITTFARVANEQEIAAFEGREVEVQEPA